MQAMQALAAQQQQQQQQPSTQARLEQGPVQREQRQRRQAPAAAAAAGAHGDDDDGDGQQPQQQQQQGPLPAVDRAAFAAALRDTLLRPVSAGEVNDLRNELAALSQFDANVSARGCRVLLNLQLCMASAMRCMLHMHAQQHAPSFNSSSCCWTALRACRPWP
jgi:hypothetical protein